MILFITTCSWLGCNRNTKANKEEVVQYFILRYIIKRRETKSLYVFKKSSDNNAQINAESKRFFTNFATEKVNLKFK